MDLKKLPDGTISPDAKMLVTGAAVGAVLGILPGVTVLGGALVGAAVSAINLLQSRS